MGHVIGIANHKGGVGKSTLASNLAVGLSVRGFSVALVDSDEQQNSSAPVAAVQPRIPIALPKSLEEIDDAVEKLRRIHQITIVDSPGERGDAIAAICLIADFLLIPIQPSPKDIRGTSSALKLVKTALRQRAGALQAMIVFNLTPKRSRAARAYREKLSKLGIPIARSQIRRLDAIRDSDSVFMSEHPDDVDAAGDINALIDEVLESIAPQIHRAGNE